jgi:hypothetical protein
MRWLRHRARRTWSRRHDVTRTRLFVAVAGAALAVLMAAVFVTAIFDAAGLVAPAPVVMGAIALFLAMIAVCVFAAAVMSVVEKRAAFRRNQQLGQSGKYRNPGWVVVVAWVTVCLVVFVLLIVGIGAVATWRYGDDAPQWIVDAAVPFCVTYFVVWIGAAIIDVQWLRRRRIRRD